MPASIYCDMNANSGLEDQRALQLAFELSLLGINGDEDTNSNSGLSTEEQRKRSANMTECVPVPSSEHVAEIVGRQGNSYSFINLDSPIARAPLVTLHLSVLFTSFYSVFHVFFALESSSFHKP